MGKIRLLGWCLLALGARNSLAKGEGHSGALMLEGGISNTATHVTTKGTNWGVLIRHTFPVGLEIGGEFASIATGESYEENGLSDFRRYFIGPFVGIRLAPFFAPRIGGNFSYVRASTADGRRFDNFDLFGIFNFSATIAIRSDLLQIGAAVIGLDFRYDVYPPVTLSQGEGVLVCSFGVGSCSTLPKGSSLSLSATLGIAY